MRCVFSTVSIAENGSSKGRFMNTCPNTCVTSTRRPCVASKIFTPRPGATLEKFSGRMMRVSGLDELQHVLLVKGMIAQRQTIRPRLQQHPRMFAGQPRALARVLAIDHDEIEAPIAAQRRQAAPPPPHAPPAPSHRQERVFSCPPGYCASPNTASPIATWPVAGGVRG